MLIECPKCHAGFDVPERLLRDRTRPLRCGQCGTVFPAPEPPAREPEKVAFTAPEPPRAEQVMDEPRAAPEPAPLAEEPQSDAEPARDTQPEAANEASSRGLRAAWVASIALLVGGGLAAIIKRDAVMEAWPPAARLFAALGLG
jgi:predicted Zn finger-like uncharacterized protein